MAINFSISLTTQKRFPLFSSNPTFLLSSTAVWLRIRAKKFQGTQSLFSATLSLVTPLSDRKVPLGGTMRILSEGILPSTSHTLSLLPSNILVLCGFIEHEQAHL